MTTYFRLRPIVRLIITLIFLIGLFILNYIVTTRQNASPLTYLTLLIPLVSLINDFAPEVLSYILRHFGPSGYQRSARASLAAFRAFLTDYFLVSLPDLSTRRALPLFTQLELACNLLPSRSFGKSDNDDKRRRPILVVIFLIWYRDHLHSQDQDALFSYIKATYRDLTDKGKTELIIAYHHLVMLERKYENINTYFSALDDMVFTEARFHLFDRFMKDDYVEEITKKLNYSDTQIRKFRASLSSIANSDRFNLGYLKRFVKSRKAYRKLFIVVSDKNLPRAIQSYITQCPHFILNYSSIANLPVLGLSKRYDVFFFSPLTLVASPTSLFNEFRSIDSRIEQHPLKIYEIDPTEALVSSMTRRSDFSQAINFFENTSIDTSLMSDLTYDQILALLERNKISIRELLKALPPAELSLSAIPAEKEFLNGVASKITGTGENADMFALVGSKREMRQRLNSLKKPPIQYTPEESESIYNSKVTLPKVKKRLLALTAEIFEGLQSIDEMVQAA